MSKPREWNVCYDPEMNELTYGHKHGCTDGFEYIKVREVTPADETNKMEMIRLKLAVSIFEIHADQTTRDRVAMIWATSDSSLKGKND